MRDRGLPLIPEASRDTPVDLLAAVQRIALQRIIDRGIVLEAMPTSNVRIGIYEDYEEHHIFRWLGLRGEFIHLDRVLRARFGMNGDEAGALLSRLNRNARIHRFRPADPTPRP